MRVFGSLPSKHTYWKGVNSMENYKKVALEVVIAIAEILLKL